uniref:Mitochondrial fission factor n=1 Tax=Phallusia mammillata TaxID=59560 RepID=A0A6F9DKW6_9ASCI|nr:mitochondrial fission factor homolog B [Phallusia mammillata]
MNLSDDPEVDTATLQQMAYNSNFTEDINIRMRVPETITVEDKIDEDQHNRNPPNFFHPSISSKYDAQNSLTALKMEVPDRIVVSVGKDGVQYDQGEMRVPSPEYGAYNPEPHLVSLKTPPRVLTLQDHSFNALDVNSQLPDDENNPEQPSFHGQSGSALTDSSMEDMDEVTLMRKQVYKLHKRLSLLEQEQATRVQRDYIVYGVTAALWLLNGWFLYNHRRLY